jgi:UDP-2,3-diacylglucosamine pyrophosphatase LpxH
VTTFELKAVFLEIAAHLLDPRTVRLPRSRFADRYAASVASEMDQLLARAEAQAEISGRPQVSLSSGRVVLFSDLHRGAGTASDDFRQNERAYNTALSYYWSMGHKLILLGDIEELWQGKPSAIFASYPRTYELEAKFHQEGRYLRVWGNHDDLWRQEHKVQQLLQPVYGEPELRVPEAVLMDVVEGETVVGTLVLTHGHHGDAKASRWAWFSRRFVRYVWSFLQRLTHAALNMPVTDWELRHRLNRAMYLWIRRHPGLVLFTGHTHAPVFESLSHTDQIEEELAQLEVSAKISPDPELCERQALLLAELEWIRTKGEQAHRRIGDGTHIIKPSYFNPGCSCYNDGGITGIEIIDGAIRLVHWPDDARGPRAQILAENSLHNVLAAR